MSGESRRPSPAMVVALAALFVALGGSSYAAIKANTVGAKQIKKNAVATSELKNGAVGTADVANGAITGEDIADESVRSADVGGLAGSDVTDGSLGPAEIAPESLRGTEVADETIGSAEVAGLGAGDVTSGTFLGGPVTAQFEQNAAELPAGQSTTLTVFCPAGQTAIGGGIRGDASDSEVTTVTGTRPAKSADNTNPPGDGESFTGWRGTVQHNAGSTTTGILPEIWAICAPTP